MVGEVPASCYICNTVMITEGTGQNNLMQHLTDYYILYLLLICRIFLKYGTGNVMNNREASNLCGFPFCVLVACQAHPKLPSFFCA